MLNALEDAEDLVIVGVVQQKENVSGAMLMNGIYYTNLLSEKVIKQARDSEIVKKQLADKEKDVFTGNVFGAEKEQSLDMESLFSINEDAFKQAFQFDPTQLNMDMSDVV